MAEKKEELEKEEIQNEEITENNELKEKRAI